MRSDGIQDQRSEDEDQKVYNRYLSDACGALHKGGCKPGGSQVQRIYSRNYDAVWQRIRRRGSLTLSRRLQLEKMVSTMVHYTAWMEKALLAAEQSQLFSPAFISKLAAVKDNLEVVAAALKRYNENDKEDGTLQVKKHAMGHVDEAVKQFAYVRRILHLEPSSVEG